MEKVRLFLFDTNNYSFDELVELFSITENEKFKFDSYKTSVSKKEHLVSYYLKKKFIGNLFLSDNKKPLSEIFKFNISHSNGLVALAINDTHEIGLDVEKIRSINENLINKVCSKDEIDYINSDKNFFEIWTAKEAYLKMTGLGIISNLNLITILPLNSLKIVENCSVFEKTFAYKDYIISICMNTNEDFEITIEELKN